MQAKFILSCESTIDLPYSYAAERELPVLFYSYMVGEQTFVDDMQRDPESLPAFYRKLETALPTTTALNEFQYEQFFDELLQKGDVLHIAFGTGMTSSYNNALLAAAALREKYPERKLAVVDSLCSSSGYGLLVDACADLRDQGKELDEVAEFANARGVTVHHQFYSTRLDFYRRSGRMSGAAAAIATVLNICPIMRLDAAGKIIAYDKVRGKKAARQRTVDTMARHALGGHDYSGKCFICNSDCREEAEALKAEVAAAFPHIDGEIRICDIGTIIASHCGPGTVAVFFFGDARAPEKEGK